MFNHRFLSNLGVTTSVLPDELYKIVMDEVEKIQNNLVDNEEWNSTLAGNIEKEYSLVKSIPHLEPFLSKMCNAYTSNCNNAGHFFEQDRKYRVHERNIWVNLQRKHEFNPVHHHGGSFSFVCWLKIPYNLSDELNAPHVKNAANKAASAFQFIYPNILGQTTLETLYVDKDWEKRIILFPAALSHCVYPFSTSDGYRISISGNLI